MLDRPNVVFIMTDQWRGDCLGCAGHPVVETPHLDHLASQGVSQGHGPYGIPANESVRLPKQLLARGCWPALAIICKLASA